jgi:hypothetical protein
MAAYNALNGRFYAGKQITCEFVGVTKWRVAICGEYLKTNYRVLHLYLYHLTNSWNASKNNFEQVKACSPIPQPC